MDRSPAAELTGVLAPPAWLRNLGLTAWLLVGVALFLVGAVWLLSLTHTIVLPVITAGLLAAVLSPTVAWLHSRGVPRAAGAVLLLLVAVLAGALVFVGVVGGIASQSDGLSNNLEEAKATVTGWLDDAGVERGEAASAGDDAESTVDGAASKLLEGVAAGLEALSSLVFFLSLTLLSLLFLLKDGPQIRAWVERHLGVPVPVAHMIGERVLQSLRGYFTGVAIVAAFNGVVVGIGAVILGVPLAGTIAIVTFLAAFVPYLGAWTAGAFSVLVALGGAGAGAAAGMIVVQLLANGVLQQLVQPIAFGATLGIHPLAVLIVTIAGGALFGAVGLILAAPVTSALTRIASDLSGAAPDETDAVAPPAETVPAPG